MNIAEKGRPQRKEKAGMRGVARLYAVQMMYRSEQEGCSVLKFLDRTGKNGINEIILSEDLSVTEMDDEFYQNLIRITSENLKRIDEIIGKKLQRNWTSERLNLVTKNILRLATAELFFMPEIPKNVVFNEYIEIAKAFFADKSEVAFVNGILNEISR